MDGGGKEYPILWGGGTENVLLYVNAWNEMRREIRIYVALQRII